MKKLIALKVFVSVNIYLRFDTLMLCTSFGLEVGLNMVRNIPLKVGVGFKMHLTSAPGGPFLFS